MPYSLDAACLCDTGKVRKNNEDNFYFDNQYLKVDNNGLANPLTMTKSLNKEFFIAVFDGMGGENYGEYASFAAAGYMQYITRKFIYHFIPVRRFLGLMCMKINGAVVAKKKELFTEHMGSTMAAFYFCHDDVYVCNLGDSRAYRLREGNLLQLSVDHIAKQGEGKKKASLIQYLGINTDHYYFEPYIDRKELREGDQFLLCSDGLTDMLSDCEIVEIMNSGDSVEACTRKLVESSLQKGGKDNVTVIVCRIL